MVLEESSMDTLDLQKDKKGILEHIKPRNCWRQKCILKLYLLYQAHHEKSGFFEKDNNTRASKASRKRERPNTTWIESIKEVIGMSLRELSRASNINHLFHSTSIKRY